MRARSRSQAGEGQLGCLFGIVLLFIAAFVAYKIIPVKVKAAELRQIVIDEGKTAGTHTDERIRKAILNVAEEQQLPVTDDDITIVRAGNQVTIDVDYVVPINFPGRTWEWHQHHHTENPIF